MDKEYWKIKILIFTETKNKVRDGLKIHGVLKYAEDPANLNTKLSMLVKNEFIEAFIKMISNNKCKTKVKDLHCNRTYPFMYDVKTTICPILKIFYINNF